VLIGVGDENKAQLQRIYGTAWENPQQLAEYKRRKEEALKRDHRKLGKELGLFIFSDSVGRVAFMDTERNFNSFFVRRFSQKRTVKTRLFTRSYSPYCSRRFV
jgi:threonyl-tRNA synthetase